MINGRLALGGLSVEFGNARKRFDELAPRVRELAEAHARLLAEEEEALHELARIYLPELSPETVARGLREMRHDLEESLRTQAQHRERLRGDVAGADAAVDSKQKTVLRLEEEEASRAAAVSERRGAVEAVLRADPEHTDWVAEHRALMARQEVLKKRRAQLASVGHYEGRRYEAHPPFAYLLARGYGTPDYRAGAVARRLDRWLARRIDFESLARSYHILRDGPRLVHAETLKLRERAAELEAWIDERESGVGRREGLLQAVADSAAADERLTAARAVLDEERARRDALVAELQAVEADKGRHYENVLARHREFLESQTMTELAQRAADTADPRDDVLVQRLHDIRRRLIDVGRELAENRRELDRVAGLTSRLAEAKRSASTRFYSRRSRFPEEFRLSQVMEPLLAGEATAHQVLDRLAQEHVTETFLGPMSGPLEGLLAGLFSSFGAGFEVREVREDDVEESDFLVFDAKGRVVERRVTRRIGDSTVQP